MKLPQLLTRKKLQATAARRGLGSTDMDYEEMSEPNMKLSRALLIVLVLHVVAVAGIIVFNTIKTRQGSAPLVANQSANTKVASTAEPKADGPTVITSTKSDDAKAVKTPPKAVAVKDDRKSDHPKSAENPPAKVDTAKTYVVAKGDNPVAIARKMKVPYDELMAANHIDDPHKLQIGQKLIIPSKTNKPKKGD